jgi:inosose dehydratase
MRPDRIGHTGITWPDTPVEQVVAEVASLGYAGFETFAFVVERYPGGASAFRDVIERHGLVFPSAYCFASYIDPATREADITQTVGLARTIRAAGGRVAVLGASAKQKPGYTAEEYRGLVATLNEIGRRTLELGVTTTFHPHTGTPVETRDEIDRVMSSVDPRYVGFAPDTGQIQKGGSEAVEVLRTYLPLVRHVHLKDWVGGVVQRNADGTEVDRTGYVDYVPVGSGVVDIPGIVALLDGAGYEGWWMVELDGTAQAPRPPREAAAMSKRYLDGLLAGAERTRSR